MDISEHIVKAARLHRSTMKFDLEQDFEMVLEGCLLASAQLINAMLHTAGVTAPAVEMMHTDLPVSGIPEQPPGLAGEAYALLAQLEWFRPLHVRGSVPHTRQVAEECWQTYLKIWGVAQRAVPGLALPSPRGS